MIYFIVEGNHEWTDHGTGAVFTSREEARLWAGRLNAAIRGFWDGAFRVIEYPEHDSDSLRAKYQGRIKHPECLSWSLDEVQPYLYSEDQS